MSLMLNPAKGSKDSKTFEGHYLFGSFEGLRLLRLFE